MAPEDELIEIAARRARSAMADEKTGFGNLLQFLRDLTRQLARSRRTGETFDLVVFEDDAEADPARVAALLRSIIRDEDVVARIGSRRYAIVVCDSESKDGRRARDLIIGKLRAMSHFAVGRRVVESSHLATATPFTLLQEATAALRRAMELGYGTVATWEYTPGSIN